MHPVSVIARHLLGSEQQQRRYSGERSVVTTRRSARTPVAQQQPVPVPAHPGWLGRVAQVALHPFSSARAAH